MLYHLYAVLSEGERCDSERYEDDDDDDDDDKDDKRMQT